MTDQQPEEGPISGTQAINEGGLVVLVEVAENGYTAEDIEHFTYGCGSTSNEAIEEWRTALRERYEVLAESENSLAPHMLQQLEAIRDYLQARAVDESAAT